MPAGGGSKPMASMPFPFACRHIPSATFLTHLLANGPINHPALRTAARIEVVTVRGMDDVKSRDQAQRHVAEPGGRRDPNAPSFERSDPKGWKAAERSPVGELIVSVILGALLVTDASAPDPSGGNHLAQARTARVPSRTDPLASAPLHSGAAASRVRGTLAAP